MKLHTGIGIFLAAAFVIPALALAQDPAPPPMGGAGSPGEHRHMMGGQQQWGGGEQKWGGDQQQWGGGQGMGMHHHGGRGGEMRERGGRGMGMAFLVNNPELRKRLGITDEQAAKIRQESLEFQKARIRTRADLEVKRLELHSLLASETPDRAAIDKAVQELGAAQLAALKPSVYFRLAARTWFTPEQRQKMREMREQFGPGGEGHRGPGGQMGPGGPRGMRRPGAQGAQGAPKPAAPPTPPPAQ
jgi:Spy/CpxP family protein refolding chaperone